MMNKKNGKNIFFTLLKLYMRFEFFNEFIKYIFICCKFLFINVTNNIFKDVVNIKNLLIKQTQIGNYVINKNVGLLLYSVKFVLKYIIFVFFIIYLIF